MPTFQKHLDQLVASHAIPGALILYSEAGEVQQFRAGWADLETKRPYESNTPVRAYSMTKAITCALTYRMLRQLGYSVETPVSVILPEFAHPRVAVGGVAGNLETVPATNELTLRHLFTHTGGLVYGYLNSTEIEKSYGLAGIDSRDGSLPLRELARRIGSIPLQSQPGSQWCYSHSHDVLAAIAEVLARKPFEELIADFAKEIGMPDTGYSLDTKKAPTRAGVYMSSDSATPGMKAFFGCIEELDGTGFCVVDRPGDAFRNERYVLGADALYTTAQDYTTFCHWLIAHGSDLFCPQLPQPLKQMLLPGAVSHVPKDSNFGLGFALDPLTGFGTWAGAANCYFVVDPHLDRTLVFVSQVVPFNLHPIFPSLWERFTN